MEQKIILGGKDFWDWLNGLYYQKFPELREISCEACGQVYRDFDNCPTCGHSRRKQLRLPEKTHGSKGE